MNNRGKYDIDKKEFLELYEEAKKGEVDVYKLPPKTLEMMCTLLEEEIKLIKRDTEKLNTNVNNC